MVASEGQGQLPAAAVGNQPPGIRMGRRQQQHEALVGRAPHAGGHGEHAADQLAHAEVRQAGVRQHGSSFPPGEQVRGQRRIEEERSPTMDGA